jgi:hypothetical protein
MTRWEYHFIQVTNAPFLHSGTVPDFVNELGRDGWELVNGSSCPLPVIRDRGRIGSFG